MADDPSWLPWLIVPAGLAGGLALAWLKSRHFIRPDRMFAAIAAGQTEPIRRHLDRYGDADIDWPDPDGYTPLLAAIVARKPEIARLLVQHGADIHRVAETRATPLTLAALMNQPRVVEALLERGARPNIPDDEGLTALHHAAAHEDSAMLAALLAHDANPNFKDAFGLTPLDRAAARPSIGDALRAAGGKPGAEVHMAQLLEGLAPQDRAAFDLPRVFSMSERDERLVAARAQAQASLDRLRAALAGGLYARVKIALPAEGGPGEAMWAEVLEHDERGLRVHVLGSPLSRPPIDEPVHLAYEELADYEFEEPKGVLHGGFTKRVTYAAMKQEYGWLPADIEEELGMYARAWPMS